MIKVKIDNENKEIEWIKEPTEEQIKNYKETFGGNLKQEIINIVEENLEEKRRLKKYAKEKRMEQDNIYNRAAGQERGE